ncbi:MAG: MarR family transcriptional regulator [Flavobacteriales bacterium]|jgi:DNA-binding MarR family transcriptional regulator|nr:MarR family transcriptional regulator [Flavobacteriales bacterium]
MAEKRHLRPEESVCFTTKTTWHAISRLYNTTGAQHDVSAASGFVLLNIDVENGTPATKIAPALGMEPRSLTRMLKTMEDKGYLERRSDPTDGRVMRIFLTEEGKKKRELAKIGVVAFNKAVRTLVPPEKLDVFFEVANTINEIIDKKSIYDKVNVNQLKIEN